MMAADWSRYGRVRWLPAVLTGAGVLVVYVLWALGHPYLALGTALVGSIASINHYLISKHAGPVEPYWVFFLSLLLALSVLALFKDSFTALASTYTAVVVFVIASSSPIVLESTLGDVMRSDDDALMVLGTAALAGLTYLYIYGTDADPIGLWVMVGPLLEFFLLKRVLLEAVKEDHPAFTTLVHVYSVASSLMFLPVPLLGAYAVLVNSVKGVARGKLIPATLLADYIIRVSLLVFLNLDSIPLPSSGL